MNGYSELRGLDLSDLIDRFLARPPEGDEYASSYFPDVAVLIRERGAAGISFLKSQLETSDTERLRAILLALSFPSVAYSELKGQLLGYIHDPRPEIVAEAIDGLRHAGVRGAAAEVLNLKQHADPTVRGSVLRYMRQLFPEQAKPVLIAALDDDDAIVRENAVDELDELDEPDVIPHLRRLLVDPHPHVRQAAQTAIENLERGSGGAGQAGARTG